MRIQLVAKHCQLGLLGLQLCFPGGFPFSTQIQKDLGPEIKDQIEKQDHEYDERMNPHKVLPEEPVVNDPDTGKIRIFRLKGRDAYQEMKYIDDKGGKKGNKEDKQKQGIKMIIPAGQLSEPGPESQRNQKTTQIIG